MNKAGIAPILLIVLLSGLFATEQSAALQPAFIQGTVHSAFSGNTVNNAAVLTTNGLRTDTSFGSFSLKVPPTVYNIIVTAEGFMANVINGIVASPGRTTTIEIHLFPASTPAGMVSGRVVHTGSTRGIAGAFIGSSLGGFTISDSEGYYEMSTPAGTAVLTSFAEGYASRVINDITIIAGETTKAVFYLNTISDDDIRLAGTVRNACSAAKINNVKVYTQTGDIAVSSKGLFSISAAAGRSTFLLSADTYLFSFDTLSIGSLADFTSHTFSLYPARNGCSLLRGTVVCSLTDNPLSDVGIASDTGFASYSRSSGSFTLYASSCTSAVSFSKDGYATTEISLSIPAGTSQSKTIELVPLSNITGYARDATDNHTIAEATVSASGPVSRVTRSDENGFYVFSDLPAGSYAISVQHICYQPADALCSTSPGESLNKNFLLSAEGYGILEGSVFDSVTGQPIADARIQAAHGSLTQSDSIGAYSIVLPACPTTLNVSSPGYLSKTVSGVRIVDGVTENRDIKLTPCPAFQLLNSCNLTPDDVFERLQKARRIRRSMLATAYGSFYITGFYRYSGEIAMLLSLYPELRTLLCETIDDVISISGSDDITAYAIADKLYSCLRMFYDLAPSVEMKRFFQAGMCDIYHLVTIVFSDANE